MPFIYVFYWVGSEFKQKNKEQRAYQGTETMICIEEICFLMKMKRRRKM